MADLTKIDLELDPEARTCRAVVETPGGKRGKFVYSPEFGAFELRAMLPAGMSFPLDFGFIPATLGEDGDPVDLLILNDEPGVVGCVLDVRLIGVIEAEQTEKGDTERNDRLVAAAVPSHLYAHLDRLEQLGDDFVDHLGQFFVNYNALRGRQFKVLGTAGPERAVELVQQACERAQEG